MRLLVFETMRSSECRYKRKDIQGLSAGALPKFRVLITKKGTVEK